MISWLLCPTTYRYKTKQFNILNRLFTKQIPRREQAIPSTCSNGYVLWGQWPLCGTVGRYRVQIPRGVAGSSFIGTTVTREPVLVRMSLEKMFLLIDLFSLFVFISEFYHIFVITVNYSKQDLSANFFLDFILNWISSLETVLWLFCWMLSVDCFHMSAGLFWETKLGSSEEPLLAGASFS